MLHLDRTKDEACRWPAASKPRTPSLSAQSPPFLGSSPPYPTALALPTSPHPLIRRVPPPGPGGFFSSTRAGVVSEPRKAAKFTAALRPHGIRSAHALPPDAQHTQRCRLPHALCADLHAHNMPLPSMLSRATKGADRVSDRRRRGEIEEMRSLQDRWHNMIGVSCIGLSSESNKAVMKSGSAWQCRMKIHYQTQTKKKRRK
ncbi:hypothetical protein C8Q79DRAFT_612942 [Trametes meyenii]|nr:hypothetical protein C8Q79DRAFT_612942 [Trametes meyenii]